MLSASHLRVSIPHVLRERTLPFRLELAHRDRAREPRDVDVVHAGAVLVEVLLLLGFVEAVEDGARVPDDIDVVDCGAVLFEITRVLAAVGAGGEGAELPVGRGVVGGGGGGGGWSGNRVVLRREGRGRRGLYVWRVWCVWRVWRVWLMVNLNNVNCGQGGKQQLLLHVGLLLYFGLLLHFGLLHFGLKRRHGLGRTARTPVVERTGTVQDASAGGAVEGWARGAG